MNYGAFSSPPLWGGREGLFFEVVRDFIFLYKTLSINLLKEIFALTNDLDAAFVIVHSHEKRGSDRKCINIHFNNSGYKFPDYLMNFHNKMRRGNSARAACTPFTPNHFLIWSMLSSRVPDTSSCTFLISTASEAMICGRSERERVLGELLPSLQSI